LLSIFTLSACSTNQKTYQQSQGSWADGIVNYESTLAPGHPDRPEVMFTIKQELRDLVRAKFSRGDKHRRARDLTRWLIDQDGHDMVYDLDANLTPEQAFSKRRGNCLSFTILLVTLANELDVALKYNDVDLPNTWDLDEQAGLVFYRHINAVFRTPNKSQVFDLAIQDYDSGYPQRTISARSAAALLHSNLGVEALKTRDMPQAFHHLKLAVSIDRKNSDLWINLGAAFKRDKQLELAEKAFLAALALNDKNSLAASNKLHDQDPKFFELSSRINQRFERYAPALKDLEKAFYLAKNADDRGRYFDKVKLVAKRAEQEIERRKQRRSNERKPRILEYPQRRF